MHLDLYYYAYVMTAIKNHYPCYSYIGIVIIPLLFFNPNILIFEVLLSIFNVLKVETWLHRNKIVSHHLVETVIQSSLIIGDNLNSVGNSAKVVYSVSVKQRFPTDENCFFTTDCVKCIFIIKFFFIFN